MTGTPRNDGTEEPRRDDSAPRETALTRYEQARFALGEAVRIDEVQSVREEAERMRLYAKQAKDRGLMADAMEIQLRAERRLGELLIAAKAAGQLSQGGRPKSETPALESSPAAQPFPDGVRAETEDARRPETRSEREQVLQRVTLKEAGIDRKLSMTSQQLAQVPEAAFELVLERARDKIVGGGAVVVNPARDLTQDEKKTRRADRAAELAVRHRALPEVKAGLIYADPAWHEEVWGTETGMDRHAGNHYPTMSLSDIQALDIASIAADDCILLMWAKTNMLVEAICVLMAWGFVVLEQDPATGFYHPDKSGPQYVSAFAWIKRNWGNGRWVRDKHEHLLIARRGHPVAPAPGTQLASAIEADNPVHSAKPEVFLDWIDKLWPDEVKIELNRRGEPRPGWHAWGNEVQEAAAAAEVTEADTVSRHGAERTGGGVSVADTAPPVAIAVSGSATLSVPAAGEGDPSASPARPSTFAEGLALWTAYRKLVAADQHKGAHTRETAEPLLRAAYACDPVIPTKTIAEDLGAPLGSVLGWASRLDLTKAERRGGPGHIGQKREAADAGR